MGLSEGLSRLASEPQLYERLSAGAIARVRDSYLWDNVGEKLKKMYMEVYQESLHNM